MHFGNGIIMGMLHRERKVGGGGGSDTLVGSEGLQVDKCWFLEINICV